MDTIADLKKRIAEGSSESLLFIASWMEAHAKEHEGAGGPTPGPSPELRQVVEALAPAPVEVWQCDGCYYGKQTPCARPMPWKTTSPNSCIWKVGTPNWHRIEPAAEQPEPAESGERCYFCEKSWNLCDCRDGPQVEPAESGERCPSCNSDALRTQGGKRGCEECGDVWEPAAPEEALAEELAAFLEASDEVAAEEPYTDMEIAHGAVQVPAEEPYSDFVVCTKCGGDGGGHDAIPVCDWCKGTGEEPPGLEPAEEPGGEEGAYQPGSAPLKAEIASLKQEVERLEAKLVERDATNHGLRHENGILTRSLTEERQRREQAEAHNERRPSAQRMPMPRPKPR